MWIQVPRNRHEYTNSKIVRFCSGGQEDEQLRRVGSCLTKNPNRPTIYQSILEKQLQIIQVVSMQKKLENNIGTRAVWRVVGNLFMENILTTKHSSPQQARPAVGSKESPIFARLSPAHLLNAWQSSDRSLGFPRPGLNTVQHESNPGQTKNWKTNSKSAWTDFAWTTADSNTPTSRWSSPKFRWNSVAYSR